jgi:hypothetical protein
MWVRHSCCALVLVSLSALASYGAEDIGPTRNAFEAIHDPFGEQVTHIRYLDQNWSPDESTKFYFTPQGSELIPYEWFLALEQAGSSTLFRDNQNILKYRYLAQVRGPMNPDGLPVGFVAGRTAGHVWLGMTCAACHTAEIRLGTIGYRIDGAPAQADAQGFLTDLTGAVQQTQVDPLKFARFSAQILHDKNTAANQAELRTQLALWLEVRVGYNRRNFPGYDSTEHLRVQPTRFGRLDAVDAIVNEAYWHAVRNPNPKNPTVVSQLADAPVSYPFLWDTPQHDRVEWLGIARGGGSFDIFSLARNVGEVIGVFGLLYVPDNPISIRLGYPSSIDFAQLEYLESLVRTLWSPQWPDDFPKIDQAAAAKGSQLYRTMRNGSPACEKCHAMIDRKDVRRSVKAVIMPTGTDARAYDNFFYPIRSSGKLAGYSANFDPFGAKIPELADANTMVTNVVIGAIIARYRAAPPNALFQVEFRGERPGAFVAESNLGAKYKARPLNGIWATAPYLHNGSVPNLDSLLQPAARRPKTFSIGVKTFDPVRVGYLTDVPGFPKLEIFDNDGQTTVGNSNAGHEYGTDLSDEERRQLIEYLKTL